MVFCIKVFVHTRFFSLIAAAILLGAFTPVRASAAENPAVSSRPAIYDEKADAAVQIRDALVTAKRENKRVLLQFGANWCPWCHKMHRLFQTDEAIAATLKQSYVLVMVDVNKDHNADTNRQYGNPRKFGIPALVVLDAGGNNLVNQDTGKLEEGDHYDPTKVLGFLKEWAAARK